MPNRLETLRRNPGAFTGVNGFRTMPNGRDFAGVSEGGLCTIVESRASEYVTDFKATAGGSDYFFPWLQRGYTWVKVPKTVHTGVVVLTGGVNGCTLIVTESAGDYYFYHDGDSNYLPEGSDKLTGTEIARVTPEDYDPDDTARTVFAGLLSSHAKANMAVEGDVSYGSYVAFVKVETEFVAVSSTVLSLGKLMVLPGREVARF